VALPTKATRQVRRIRYILRRLEAVISDRTDVKKQEQ
jgi:hypothetical protein